MGIQGIIIDIAVTCQFILPRSTPFLMPMVLHLLGSKTGNRLRLGRTISQALKPRQAPGGHTLRMEQPKACAHSHDNLSDLRDETLSLTLPSTSSARDGD